MTKRLTEYGAVLLRLALGAAFLSAVADRRGQGRGGAVVLPPCIGAERAASTGEPVEPQAARLGGGSPGELGDVKVLAGDGEGALRSYEQAAAVYGELAAADEADWLTRRALAALYFKMGGEQSRPQAGRTSPARVAGDYYSRAAATWRRMREAGTPTRADARSLEDAERRVQPRP